VEFDAMLRGALGDQPKVHAYFIDRDGNIIATTDPTRPVLGQLSIARHLSEMDNGRSGSCLLTHDDHYALMGCTVSHGYREFKVSDGRPVDVLAVVVESFGTVRSSTAESATPARRLNAPLGREHGMEFATFFAGSSLFAMLAGDVHEARAASKLSSVSMGGGGACIGILPLEERDDDAAEFVWAYDLGFLITGQITPIDSRAQIVVVRHDSRTVGLLVSELHDVAKFNEEDLIALPLARQDGGMLVSHVINANQGDVLIQRIDTPHLFDLLDNNRRTSQ